MTTTPRYKGVSLDLGGTVFTVAAMSLGIIESFQDRIQAVEAGQEINPLPVVVDLLHACLKRNHSDIPRSLVADHVDLDNWEECMAMVLGASGYKRWQETSTEATEGNAGATTNPGTGQPSTPTSSPVAPAGPSTTAETS